MPGFFTLCAFTENTVGLLNRLTGVLARRRINIESLSVSETERKGVSRITIVIKSDYAIVEKLVRQIRKVVEVLAVFGYENKDLVYNEIALYKLDAEKAGAADELIRLVNRYDGKLLTSEAKYHIIEKMGTEEDIHNFFRALKPYGIMEFVRSGRIALARNENGLSNYLPKAQWEYRL